jgi:hypothetical protein
MSTIGVVIITFSLAVIAAGFWLIYRYDNKRLGPYAAKLLYPKHFAKYVSIAILVLMLGLSMELDNVVTLLLPAFVLVVVAVQLIRGTWKPSKNQEVIFDLTHTNQYRNGEVVGFAILGSFHLLGALVFWLLEGLFEERLIILGILGLALSAFFAIQNSRARLFLSKEGISNRGTYVPWDQINGHFWGEVWGGSNTLFFDRGGLFSRFRYLEFKVPAHMKEEIEEFLVNVLSRS